MVELDEAIDSSMKLEDDGFEGLNKVVGKVKRNNKKLPKLTSHYLKLLNKNKNGDEDVVVSSSSSGFDSEDEAENILRLESLKITT